MRKVRLNLVNSHPRSIDCISDKTSVCSQDLLLLLPVLSFQFDRPSPRRRPWPRSESHVTYSASVRKGHWSSSALMLDAPLEHGSEHRSGVREFCIRGGLWTEEVFPENWGSGNVIERRGEENAKRNMGVNLLGDKRSRVLREVVEA